MRLSVPPTRLLILAPLLVVSLPLRAADPPRSVKLTLKETLGQRRFGYPVFAHVPLPQGAVRDPAATALLDRETPMRGVQYDALQRWADGSVQWLGVSFNASPGPGESKDFGLDFGEGVTHPDPGAGVVQETAEGIAVRTNYRFPKRGAQFLDSIRYGSREFLREPAHWIAGTGLDSDGQTFETEHARVLQYGPILAAVELEGKCSGLGPNARFQMEVRLPNSKSWFDAGLEVTNPERRRGWVELDIPYRMDAPLMWDFGVGSWLYGTLKRGEAAELTVGRRPAWTLFTSAAGKPPSPYATATDEQPHAEGWGHVLATLPGGPAVAFGSPELASGGKGGGGRMHVTADGHVRLRWTTSGQSRFRCRALFHHVGNPVQVTAVTSPPAMLHPLELSLPREWYRKCGVPEPRQR